MPTLIEREIEKIRVGVKMFSTSDAFLKAKWRDQQITMLRDFMSRRLRLLYCLPDLDSVAAKIYEHSKSLQVTIVVRLIYADGSVTEIGMDIEQWTLK